MIEKLRDSRGWQLLIITTLILIVPLMADINGRIGVIQAMRAEESHLRKEISKAETENARLRQELDQIATESYLERWARVEARMTRPGEVAVIPVFLESSEPSIAAPDTSPATADAAPTVADQWRRLFFDAADAP